MRRSSPQLAVLARRSRPSLAFACITFLMLGSSANAGTVLIFGQVNPLDVVTLTNGGAGSSTLSTAGNADGGGVSIPVVITTFLGVPGTSIPAFETYVGVASTGPAASFLGQDFQSFSGTIEFTSLPGGAGANYLTAAFANVGANINANFGADKGNSATLQASQPPASLILTSSFSPLFAPTSMSIAFSNLTPALQIFNGSLGARGKTTMQSAGDFSATVPEPASMVLLGIGMSGFFALRRFFKRSVVA